jgi:hypothetical protein
LAASDPLAPTEKEEMFASAEFFFNTQGLSSTNNACYHSTLFLNLSQALHAHGCVACGLGFFAPFPIFLL